MGTISNLISNSRIKTANKRAEDEKLLYVHSVRNIFQSSWYPPDRNKAKGFYKSSVSSAPEGRSLEAIIRNGLQCLSSISLTRIRIARSLHKITSASTVTIQSVFLRNWVLVRQRTPLSTIDIGEEKAANCSDTNQSGEVSELKSSAQYRWCTAVTILKREGGVVVN